MSEEDYFAYLSTYREEGYEPIGRMLKNGFGQPERVVLPQNYWDYYDWLAKRGFKVEDWVQKLDLKNIPGKCLSDKVMTNLWRDECKRHREGRPTPTPEPPEGYVE